MAAVTQALLASYGVAAPISAHFVNEYAINFASTTSATATIPAIDLTLPASATKQILVFVGAEAPLITQITINGVRAGWIMANGFFVGGSAIYAGAGPFNIVITVASASAELGGVLVYEFDKAAPLYESLMGWGSANTVAHLQQLPGDVLVAAGLHLTDTTTFTWAGPTENFDADVGDYRLSSAVDFTPVISRQNRTVTANPPNPPEELRSLSVHRVGTASGIRGGFSTASSIAGSGSTFTYTGTIDTNLNNLGNFDLVIGFCVEATVTVTGVTFNGVAMTARGNVLNTTATPDLLVYYFSISLTDGAASGNIVITCSASVAGISCIMNKWYLYGVASYGTVVSSQGSATGAATAVSINDGGAALFCAIGGTAGNAITITGTNVNTKLNVASFSNAAYASADIVNDASGSKTFTTSFTSMQYAQAALPVNP